MKKLEKIDKNRTEKIWAEKRARKELEDKLLGKKILLPGVQIKVTRKDFENEEIILKRPLRS